MMPNTRTLKRKLFSLLSATLVTLTVLATSIAYLLISQNTLTSRYYTLQVAAQKIAYYDELLTMSAIVGVYSGDPHWKTRYDEAAVALDEILLQAISIDRAIADFVQRTSNANQVLISYEQKAFDFALKGQADAALNLLTNEIYLVNKAEFSKGLQEALNNLVSETETALDRTNQLRVMLLMIIFVFLIIVLFSLWIYLARVLKIF